VKALLTAQVVPRPLPYPRGSSVLFVDFHQTTHVSSVEHAIAVCAAWGPTKTQDASSGLHELCYQSV